MPHVLEELSISSRSMMQILRESKKDCRHHISLGLPTDQYMCVRCSAFHWTSRTMLQAGELRNLYRLHPSVGTLRFISSH